MSRLTRSDNDVNGGDCVACPGEVVPGDTFLVGPYVFLDRPYVFRNVKPAAVSSCRRKGTVEKVLESEHRIGLK